MAETFVTLDEAAKFEGLSYKGMTSRIQRNTESYKTKTEARDGGKDRVLVAVSSLSKQARRAYKEARQIDGVNGGDVVVENRTGQENPWYVETDLNWYIENFKTEYYGAVEFAKQIQEFLDYNEGERTAFADEFAARLGISRRTLYRYSKDYLTASAWAMKLQKQDGKNYEFLKVLSLCRKPKGKYTFPSMTEEVRALVENIWFDKIFAANDGTVEMLYQKLEQVGKDKGWEYPSYPTIARYIQYLMEVERGKNAHFLAAKGVREYKNKVMVKRSRNTGALPVMGLVQGDGHTFDCWVQIKLANGRVKAIKPKLVAWIDTRSRVIMGDIICRDSNSQIIKQSLLKMIYGTPGGVPRWLLIDNGKDYTAETMTGRKRTERFSIEFDDETKGFYRGIGIEDDIRSLPYQPWSKAQMERAFGTVCSMFTKWLASYTGTLTGSRTAGKIKKDIPGMSERGELLTMEEFQQLWRKWLTEVYYKRKHSGLKRQGETYTSPIDCFMNAEDRYFKPVPAKSYASMLMMKSDNALVRNIGIRKFGKDYMAPELVDYIEDKVDIKWDPEDVTRLYVYVAKSKNGKNKGEKICEAVCQELLLIAPKVPQKALEEHMKLQNQQFRGDREKNKKYTTPLEERVARHHETPPDAVGGIDLMIKGNHSNVVALPQDRQFTEEVRSKKTRPDVDNEFLFSRGRRALEMIKKLG